MDMSSKVFPIQSRRGFLATGTAAFGTALATPAIAQIAGSTEFEADLGDVQRNVSSFRSFDWRTYFTDLDRGAILCDVQSRTLHYWGPNESVFRLYPSSVPLTDDLTRLGRTRITQKVVAPTWRPTPSMRERNPEWPDVVAGGDPRNPLGALALYLSWQYYRIHGTPVSDTDKIGRRSSNGCIGLFNSDITELFEMAQVGTPVMLI